MALFGKKKEGENSCCCDDVSAESMAQAAQNEGSAVKILGSGCKNPVMHEKSCYSAL